MKFSKLSLFVLFVLISGYARSQCTNLRFSSTANTWPTVNPLPTAGGVQRLCLQQNLTGGPPAAVNVFTSAAVVLSGVTWTVIGTGVTKVAPENNSQCGFQLTSPPSSPFDFGKARVVVRYTAGACGCIDTLDIYRQMNPQTSPSFAPIQGPTCLAPGAIGQYYVDPRFSRPANIALGIGLDGPYNWTVLNNGTAGVGTWRLGALTTLPVLVAAGDRSSLEIQAAPGGAGNWTNTTATLQVVEGPTCNTNLVPFTITRGNPAALITVNPAAPAPYTAVVVNESYQLPTNSAQAITLTAPTGASTPYSWSQDGGLGYTLTVSGTMNETCIVTPNSGAAARSGRVTLTSIGCSGGSGTSDYVEIRRTLITGTNSLSTPAGCQTAGSNVIINVTTPPGGVPSNYVWNITNGATGWPAMPINTTVPSLTVVPSANAQPAIFRCQLNGQTVGSALVSAVVTVSGNQGYTFTMPAAANVGANIIRYDIFTTNFTPALPGACLESNLYFDWTYTGGSNATFSPPDNCGASTGNITRVTAGTAFGGGTLNVSISAQGPGNVCASCGLSCLLVTGTANPPTRARPGKGGSDPTKNISNPGDRTSEISLFPNPVNDLLTIVSKDFSDSDLIEIFDSNGRKYKILNPENQKTIVNLKGFPAGSYLIRYHFSEDVVVTKTFIKN